MMTFEVTPTNKVASEHPLSEDGHYTANHSPNWFLTVADPAKGIPKKPKITNNNTIDFFICGEESFNSIVQD